MAKPGLGLVECGTEHPDSPRPPSGRETIYLTTLKNGLTKEERIYAEFLRDI